MQERQLFEYAVIRVVPRVEREEFVNVGVMVYCAKMKFLKAVYLIDEHKLSAFSKELDINDIRAHVAALSSICEGGKGAGPIGELDAASRFRWLTALRSTVLQTSRVHPGFCADPAKKLDALFAEQVLS